MSPKLLSRRTLALSGILLTLAALFLYVALRSGPLAPVPVVVTALSNQPLAPALFGVGTVEARYTYRLGPNAAGRVKGVYVQVGERVKAGQLLAEMDPVDMEDRLEAQRASVLREEAAVRTAEARVEEAFARHSYAEAQEGRYGQLLSAGSVSREAAEAKQQELKVAGAGRGTAQANLAGAQEGLAASRAALKGLLRQSANLRLFAPAGGLVTLRNAEPGSTVVAGQSLVEVVDTASLWINVRLDQLKASGLRPGLAARITLRSRQGEPLAGHLLRVEPLADAVTEEAVAKVAFDVLPEPLPPLGELAEVTLELPPLGPAPVLPNACLQRLGGQSGVWVAEGGRVRFAPVRLGASDLEGRVQVLGGLGQGEQVVLYSLKALGPASRIKVVDRLPGVPAP